MSIKLYVSHLHWVWVAPIYRATHTKSKILSDPQTDTLALTGKSWGGCHSWLNSWSWFCTQCTFSHLKHWILRNIFPLIVQLTPRSPYPYQLHHKPFAPQTYFFFAHILFIQLPQSNSMVSITFPFLDLHSSSLKYFSYLSQILFLSASIYTLCQI